MIAITLHESVNLNSPKKLEAYLNLIFIKKMILFKHQIYSSVFKYLKFLINTFKHNIKSEINKYKS